MRGREWEHCRCYYYYSFRYCCWYPLFDVDGHRNQVWKEKRACRVNVQVLVMYLATRSPGNWIDLDVHLTWTREEERKSVKISMSMEWQLRGQIADT